jgi:hypothetical protein
MSLPARLLRAIRSRLQLLFVNTRLQYVRAWPYFAARKARGIHPVLDEAALKKLRRSDTAFVFGSGYSLNDITPDEWREVARHDTFGFNYFSRQRFVRTDFHVIGEIASRTDYLERDWVPALQEYAKLLTDNPFYSETVLGVQRGWPAFQSNRLLAMGLLPPERRIFEYHRVARGEFRPPTRSLAEGLVLGAGSVCACVNLAYILGAKQIVLAGVDLYDARYFWLPPDAVREDMVLSRGTQKGEPHHAAERMTEYLGRWRGLLEPEGVTLSVQNPRSLLARVMPVYQIAR